MEQIEIMPARIRIASVLRKAILAGEFKKDEELSLTDLSRQLGVSRTPIREAFQTLENEGLIELRMNKGAIVKGINTKFITDHFEVRMLLEREAVIRAIKNNMDVSSLTQLQDETAQKADSITEEDFVPYNQMFHTMIWQAADNQKLYNLLMNLWNGPSAGKAVVHEDHYKKSIDEHGKILRFIASRDIDKAGKAMEKHISRSMDNLLNSFKM